MDALLTDFVKDFVKVGRAVETAEDAWMANIFICKVCFCRGFLGALSSFAFFAFFASPPDYKRIRRIQNFRVSVHLGFRTTKGSAESFFKKSLISKRAMYETKGDSVNAFKTVTAEQVQDRGFIRKLLQVL